MKIHFIIHEEFESPGAIETWAKTKGYALSYSRLHANESLPTSCLDYDFLIIMGGPQSPSTTLEECAHFDAKKEIDCIKQAILANKLVLGVCLGAQLIGEALGANYAKSPHKEIGFFPINLHESASDDPMLSGLPTQFLVGHWHNDMPGLTSDAEILASSQGCPRQIVRYCQGVYGFQCHFEFTLETIEQMIQHCYQDISENPSLPFIQSEDQLRDFNFSSMNNHLYRFLDNMVASYTPQVLNLVNKSQEDKNNSVKF